MQGQKQAQKNSDPFRQNDAENDPISENPEPFEPNKPSREYTLSEAQKADLGRAFAIIAELAPTLGEAELRVLIEITRQFGATEHKSGRISSRKLAEATKLARPNTQKALDSLNEKKIIATRDGTATSAADHALTYLRITQMGGSFTMPPLASKQSQGGSFTMPPLASKQSQGGIVTMPPPIEEHARAGASIDSIEPDSIIDRCLRAREKHFKPAELERAKQLIWGYQLKFGPDHNSHPPDGDILAQFLAVAEWHRLEAMVYNELMPDREKPGYKYSWYVTVALQKIHGIKPAILKARRAELRIVRPPPPAAIAGEQQPLELRADEPETDPQFGRELMGEVIARRAAKGRA